MKITLTHPNPLFEKEREDIYNPRIHNLRPCPSCNKPIFGMPGGRDAVCKNCGYKDPCCSD